MNVCIDIIVMVVVIVIVIIINPASTFKGPDFGMYLLLPFQSPPIALWLFVAPKSAGVLGTGAPTEHRPPHIQGEKHPLS